MGTKLSSAVKCILQALSVLLVFVFVVGKEDHIFPALMASGALVAFYIWLGRRKKRARAAEIESMLRSVEEDQQRALKAEYDRLMAANPLTEFERQQLELTLKSRNLLPSEYGELLRRETIYIQQRKAGIR